MTAHAPAHSPVLVQAAIDALGIEDSDGRDGRRDGIYIDATFGRGGHTRLMLARLGAGGGLLRLIVMNRRSQRVGN